MTPILQQFLSESRDFLQGIGEKLIQLEETPSSAAMMTELFRSVHTMKGNSGLFEFPEMSRVLHAAEDLMVTVRDGNLIYSKLLADRLLEAMDFVGMLLDEIESSGSNNVSHIGTSAKLAESLRQLIPIPVGTQRTGNVLDIALPNQVKDVVSTILASLQRVPESLRKSWHQHAIDFTPLLWVSYTPDEGCFFIGEDPFLKVRQAPQIQWQCVTVREPWPSLEELDAYRCVVSFQFVSDASLVELEEHFRYIPEQITFHNLSPSLLAQSLGLSGMPSVDHTIDTKVFCAPDDAVGQIVDTVLSAQLAILRMPDKVSWLPGRLKAVGSTLSSCYLSTGQSGLLPELHVVLAAALEQQTAMPLLAWLTQYIEHLGTEISPHIPLSTQPLTTTAAASESVGSEPKLGRRAEDVVVGMRTLKVDQDKIDRLMNLIGEMVVAKNGLPYLAGRAEAVFGVRELSREIKNQYSVINRIAEEMQDAIMQVRMMPVSFVFQRFPRLVRDISRKLGKEVSLVLEGEDTEADKNIIEALADPLIHIVRNSLDHGIEMPLVRQTAGKAVAGRLVIRASRESDRVIIDVSDDGKGIDPEIIKRKAYEKGLIDEATLDRISDQDAINLVFAAGFSTVEVVSDLSGRGVGMDVVRAAVEQVNGTVTLESKPGQGTCLRLSLPLSMAVTNVMVIESDEQIFGVPMDIVVETVRVNRSSIHSIKDHQMMVLRGNIVPLRTLNGLLSSDKPQLANLEDEFATLVIRMQGESVGIVVDDFREVIDIILKPMAGILGGLPGYAGSALMGDGSVLMVLNPKELLQ